MDDGDYHDTMADQAEDHTCREAENRERFLLGLAAAYALWHAGEPGGHQPGTFTSSILTAWTYADDDNHQRLSAGFPELGWAVERLRAGEYDMLRHAVARANQVFA